MLTAVYAAHIYIYIRALKSVYVYIFWYMKFCFVYDSFQDVVEPFMKKNLYIYIYIYSFPLSRVEMRCFSFSYLSYFLSIFFFLLPTNFGV